MLRRSSWYRPDPVEEGYRFGDNEVFLLSYRARTAQGEIDLTEMEVRVLSLFFQQRGGDHPARRTAAVGLGLCQRYRDPHPGQLHRPAAQVFRTGPDPSGPFQDRARGRLPLHPPGADHAPTPSPTPQTALGRQSCRQLVNQLKSDNKPGQRQLPRAVPQASRLDLRQVRPGIRTGEPAALNGPPPGRQSPQQPARWQQLGKPVRLLP